RGHPLLARRAPPCLRVGLLSRPSQHWALALSSCRTPGWWRPQALGLGDEGVEVGGVAGSLTAGEPVAEGGAASSGAFLANEAGGDGAFEPACQGGVAGAREVVGPVGAELAAGAFGGGVFQHAAEPVPVLRELVLGEVAVGEVIGGVGIQFDDQATR